MLFALALLAAAGPAVAQAPAAAPAGAPPPAAPAAPQRGAPGQPEPPKQDETFPEEDCRKLTQSKAPVEMIARLDGPLSVRNLEGIYFGKPLYLLTPEEFAYLRRLVPFCKKSKPEVANAMIDGLMKKVAEAKATRNKSIEWIKDVVAKGDRLPPSPESVREIANMWTSMMNRQQEMMPSDLRYLADYLNKRRIEINQGKQARERVLVSPFDPGPVLPRDRR
jgi:hypothetical protein